MAELLLHFELAAGQPAATTAQEHEQRLAKLPGVSEAEALPQESRLTGLTGLEIVGAISAAVVVIRHGRELVTELNQLLPEIRKLIREVKGLKNAFVEVGSKRVPVAQITAEQIEELAR